MPMAKTKTKAKSLVKGKAKPSTLEKPILASIAGLKHPTMAMGESELN